MNWERSESFGLVLACAFIVGIWSLDLTNHGAHYEQATIYSSDSNGVGTTDNNDATADSPQHADNDGPRITDCLLVLFNGLLALFTYKLFTATKDLFGATKAAADAADQSARALIASERAYVYVRDFEPIAITNAEGIVTGFQCVMFWVNAGTTPTRDLVTHVNWVRSANPLPDNFDFPNIPDDSNEISGSVLGPKGEMSTITFSISAEQIGELMNESTFMYIWGFAEYRDIFPNTPVRRTEFCNRVVGMPVPGNPQAAVIAFRHYKTHNSAT
jgi:hypothetical protein